MIRYSKLSGRSKLLKVTFLGHVLNKRTYPVPEWLYKRL